MRWVLMLAALTLLLDGKAWSADQERIEKAKATYQNICQSCHGERGDGKGPVAPTLRTKPKDFVKLTNKSEDYLFRVIKEGGPAVKMSPMMPGYAAQLKDEEIREMVSYVLTLSEPKKK